jgi:hypothetical protein
MNQFQWFGSMRGGEMGWQSVTFGKLTGRTYSGTISSFILFIGNITAL